MHRPMMVMNKHRKYPKRPVDLLSPTATTAALKNISALPTTGAFDHTHRPGTIEWQEPKLTYQPQEKKGDDGDNRAVVLGPVYRLPVDSDDAAGTQIDLKWTYANLKVRPERITIEAIGPNKATWTVSVMEGTMTSATWDLRATPSYSPLIEGYYTLQVHDQRGQGSQPKPGWLLPDSKMKIALYKTTEGNNHIGEKIARECHDSTSCMIATNSVLDVAFECATCFNYVMKDFDGRVQASTNKNYANRTLMMIIFFLWTLLQCSVG